MSRLLEVGLAMMDIRDENEALRADLKRQQAVVEAAQEFDTWLIRLGINAVDGTHLGDLRKALAAVDAPPEGDGTK